MMYSGLIPMKRSCVWSKTIGYIGTYSVFWVSTAMAALQFIRVKPPHQLYPLWEIWLNLLGVTMTCRKEYWIAVSFHQTCIVFGDRWVFNWEIFSKDSYQMFPFYSWENMDIGIKMSASFWMESFPKPCQIFMVTCFLPFLVYTGILVCDMNTNSY